MEVKARLRLGGVQDKVIMCGGVATNIGVVKALENAFGASVQISEEPQIVGALGAALANNR